MVFHTTFRLKIWFFLLFFSLFLFIQVSTVFAADEDQESDRQEQHFIHFRYGPEVAYSSSQSSGSYTAHATSHTPTEVQIQTGQTNIKQTLSGMGDHLSVGDTLKVYASAGDAGFHAVHGSIGAGDINPNVSRQLGQNRQKFHQEVLFDMAKSIQGKTLELGVNDFGSGADPAKINAKGDIDFTLYAKAVGVEAQWLVDQYNKTFKKLAKSRYGVDLTPGQMDIVAHRYDATIPDHRVRQSVADFELKLKTGTRLLRANPEAYFLEGSYLQQIMGRSIAPDKKTFTWYKPDKNAEKGIKVIRTNAGAVPQFFYKPNFRKALGFGGAVGNYHFHHAHSGSFIAKTKYILRSLDNGPGLLVAGKRGDYMDIGSKEDVANGLDDPVGRAERRKIIDDIYDSPQLKYSDALRQEIFESYEICRKARIAKDLNKPMTDQDLYGSLAEYHKKISQTKLDDGRTVQFKIDDAAAMKLAKQTFKSTSELILTTNVVRTAGKRAKEWLRPHTLKNRTTYIDEDGNIVSVKSSKMDLRRLQFAAFQEIHDAIQILQQDKKQHVIELLKKSNPAMKRDIELIEGIIKKKREMMLAPKDKNPEDAMTYRQKAAKGVIDAFEQLGKHKSTAPMWSKVFKSANDAWATGQALESYVYSNLTQAMIYSGGKKYGPALESLRQSTENVNKQIMNPVWMTRISRANSVVHILTLYVEEDAFNERVLKQAIIEGLSHFPLIGMPIDIYRGTVSGLLNHKGGLSGLTRAALGSGVGQIVLSQFIPGYGPVILVVNTAKGVVNLGGTILFTPLKNQRVKLAYQGYLDPVDFSGSDQYTKWLIDKNVEVVKNSISWWFNSTGRKDRIYSPRPSVLHPIDPELKMTLQERRTGVLRYFQPQFVAAFKDKWGGGATVNEFPNMYSKIENDLLPKVMLSHVNDWWEGQGVFSEYDSLVVKRMMDEYYSKEMKQKIVNMLISDYIAGKGELIKKENGWFDTLKRMYAFLAGLARDYTKWYIETLPLIHEDHKTAAMMVMGLELEQAEKIKPKIELVSSPKVIMGIDKEGNNTPIIERINVRAKLLVSETEERPGPYTIHFKLKSAGSEKQVNETDKVSFQFKPGHVPESITLTALALDANNQVFHEQDIVVPLLEKETTADYDGGQDLDEVFKRLEELAKQAENQEQLAKKDIEFAKISMTHAEKEKSTLIQLVEQIKLKQNNIANQIKSLTSISSIISKDIVSNRLLIKNIQETAQQALQLSRHICDAIQDLENQPNNKETILKIVAAQKQQLNRLVSDGKKLHNTFENKSNTIHNNITKGMGKANTIDPVIYELSKLPEDESMLNHLIDADTWLMAAKEDHATIEDLLTDAKLEYDKGRSFIKELEADQPKKEEYHKKLNTFFDRIESADSKTKLLLDKTSKNMDALNKRGLNLSEKIEQSNSKTDTIRANFKKERNKLAQLQNDTARLDLEEQKINTFVETLLNAQLDADICSESIQNQVNNQNSEKCNEITQQLNTAYLNSDADTYRRLLDQYKDCPKYHQAQNVLQNLIQNNQRCNQLVQQLNTAKKNGDSVTYGHLLNQYKECKFYDQAQSVYTAMLQTDQRCNTIAGQLNAAQQRGDIQTFQRLLNQFKDCNNYNSAVTTYNNMVRNSNNQRCQILLSQLNAAQKRRDVRTYGNLLNQARNCPFYNQALGIYNGMKNQQNMQAFNNFLGGMMQIIDQQNQQDNRNNRPPAPPRNNPPGNSYNRPPQPARPPSTQNNQPNRLSRADCEKKFCPVCTTGGSIDLLGQSVNQQCNDCRSRNKNKIADCMRGGVSANRPGTSMSQFRNYQLFKCRVTARDGSGRIINRRTIYDFAGPSRRRPAGAECSLIQNCTWEECIDLAQKYNQQNGTGHQVMP